MNENNQDLNKDEEIDPFNENSHNLIDEENKNNEELENKNINNGFGIIIESEEEKSDENIINGVVLSENDNLMNIKPDYNIEESEKDSIIEYYKEESKPKEKIKHRFGEWLLNKKLITEIALEAAVKEQEVTGEKIGQILVAGGFLSDKKRVEGILELNSERIVQEDVSTCKIPSDILDKYSIHIPAITDSTIYVGTMYDEDVVEQIVKDYYPKKKIEFVSFMPSKIDSFIAKMNRTIDIADIAAPKELMLDRILFRALQDGASDIHILQRNKSYTVLFRKLGVRKIIHEGTMDEYYIVISQIKDRARMDLAEKRRPQDGNFQIEYNNKLVDLRIATAPVAEGENCVIRVLDPDRAQPSLSDLGITEIKQWRRGFNQQHGLCLICGPTGSGKTTTLNASIKEMDRFGKAIYTIEDPVEYRIPYVSQVSVNRLVDLDFAQGVRAFMRMDPDVIILGEVRDEETARNVIKAADTGHMVLATLHTGSIIGAASRLRDIGVEPRELRYLLRSVLVQNLVRTVCPVCHGAGCFECAEIGYTDRTMVSECQYFPDYESVDRILPIGNNQPEISWTRIEEDAVLKMRQGITDEKEIKRVFGEEVIDRCLRGYKE